MEFSLKFNVKKSVQAVNYFASLCQQNSISRLKVLKLLFFVDKFLIRNEGSMLTNDRYCALKFGPIASNISDFKHGADVFDSFSTDEKNYLNKFLICTRREYKSNEKVNLKTFSDYEIHIPPKFFP